MVGEGGSGLAVCRHRGLPSLEILQGTLRIRRRCCGSRSSVTPLLRSAPPLPALLSYPLPPAVRPLDARLLRPRLARRLQRPRTPRVRCARRRVAGPRAGAVAAPAARGAAAYLRHLDRCAEAGHALRHALPCRAHVKTFSDLHLIGACSPPLNLPLSSAYRPQQARPPNPASPGP